MSAALEILEELFKEERLLKEYIEAEEAYQQAAENLKDHFLPSFMELIDEAVTNTADRHEILQMLKRRFTECPDTITVSYALAYLSEKGLRDHLNGLA